MELDFPAQESFSEEPWPAWEQHVERRTQEASQHEAERQNGALPYVAPKIIRFPVPPFSRLPVGEAELEPGTERQSVAARIVDSEPETEQSAEQLVAAETDAYVVASEHEPQQMELPCFDDIRLESDTHKDLDIVEHAPQAAPLGQRALAGATDLAMVGLGLLAFKLTFTTLAEADPRNKVALLCAFAVTGALWVMYQYLFLVHGKRTVGMALTGLELTSFSGHAVGTTGRRWRALATAISAFSLGLGFAWALLDEDRLGWHDRMTGTVVKTSGDLAIG
jgi:uncharacterized RDD family membrane protein YckC